MRSYDRFLRVVSVLALVLAIAATERAQTSKSKPHDSAGGQKLLASHCASCHGLDGKGSEHAPNIADRAKRMPQTQLVQIIQNGVPGTGMPAFHTLSSAQINSLVTYLRTLGGTAKTAQMPGDPKAGKILFASTAGCSRCHMVSGEGGFIASNLSDYAQSHSAEQIRSAIVSPAASRNDAGRLATVTLRSGEKHTGRVRNEDNFSIQLQTVDGTFHLLSRSEVENFEYDSKLMMPADYRDTLTPKNIDDLVSYLMSASSGAPHTGHKKHHDDDDEDCSPSCD